VSKWVISDADKTRYDDMFEKADTDRDGFVSGTEIKGIFLKSGLAQPVLARIWYDQLLIVTSNSTAISCVVPRVCLIKLLYLL